MPVPLSKDILRTVLFQDGKTYTVRLRAGLRPGIEFREKGKVKWTSMVLLEQVRVMAERGQL